MNLRHLTANPEGPADNFIACTVLWSRTILKTFTIMIPLVGLVLTSQAQITNNIAVAPQLLTNSNTPQTLPAFSVPQFNTASAR